tara:strand:- start:162 stop:494 length:333 start_codon:yes stop_codon:yes gene_type:complete
LKDGQLKKRLSRRLSFHQLSTAVASQEEVEHSSFEFCHTLSNLEIEFCCSLALFHLCPLGVFSPVGAFVAFSYTLTPFEAPNAFTGRSMAFITFPRVPVRKPPATLQLKV